MRTLPKWLFGAIACLGWPAAHARTLPPTHAHMSTTAHTRASVPGPTAPATNPSFRLDSVRSADGTPIAYRIYVQEPGLLIVQGAMGIAYNDGLG